MPERHWIEELPQHAGEAVAVRGWVSTTRSSGKIAFVVVRDGTGYLQAVISKKDVAPEVWDAFGKLTQETSLEVTGSVRADARAPGGVELQTSDLKIIGPSPEFPITPKEHGIAYLFEHRHLWLRSRQQVAIARVRHEVVQAIRDFLYDRHLTEFWMVEPEVAWNDSAANMRLQEDFVSYVVGRCLERRKQDLAELGRDLAPLERVQAPFHRISYTDAVAKLKELGGDMEWGRDLGGEDETTLAKQYDRPVFVYNYPKAVKAFYMKENPADPRTVLNNDCLAPEGYGEIIGGSQREDDYDKLLARIRAEKLPEEAYSWYLDLRKYGTFVHSGFGLGVERTVAWICGIPHIREAIAFPRTLYRLWP